MKGVTKKCIVHHHAHLRQFFFNVHTEKLMPHLQLSFGSWLNNADWEVYIFLLKSILWWLEKVSFQTA